MAPDPPPPLALPFADEAGETEARTDIDLMAPPVPRQKGFKITFGRMLDFGTTDGCSACEAFSKTMPHGAKCRECFRKLLKVDGELPEQPTANAADNDEPAFFSRLTSPPKKATKKNTFGIPIHMFQHTFLLKKMMSSMRVS